MGWLPYFIDGSQTPNSPNVATWNSQANAWAVDIKSQRKLEELNQTLWMFVSAPPGADAINYNYDLSVGLKLPESSQNQDAAGPQPGAPSPAGGGTLVLDEVSHLPALDNVC